MNGLTSLFAGDRKEDDDYERAITSSYARLSELELPFEYRRFVVELCKSQSANMKLFGFCGDVSHAELLGRFVNLAISMMHMDADGLESYVRSIDSYVDLCKEEAKAVTR